MYQGLPQFCERICKECDPETPECYLRLRQGEKQRSGYLIATKIPATGRDPVEVANELYERIENSGTDAVWIEAMHKGGTNPADSFKVPSREDGPRQETPADRMAVVVERMARSADERAAGTEYRCAQANERLADLVGEIWAERLKLRELELTNGGGDMREALKMAMPVVAMGAARLLGGPAPEPSETPEPDNEVEIGDAVDTAIAYLNAAVAEDPDLITPERIEALTPLVVQAVGLGSK